MGLTAKCVAIGIVVTAACATAPRAFAQATREEAIAAEKAAKAARVEPPDEGGDRFFSTVEHLLASDPPGVKVTVGGFRPGAGFAPGVAWVVPAGDRARWTTKAAWSVKNFRLLESSFNAPVPGTDRVDLEPLVRWEDAPTLPFFGLGPSASVAGEIDYGLRSSEAGVNARVRVSPWFRVGTGVEYLDTAVTGAPQGPSNASWLHSSGYAAIDTRASAGYTDRGTLCQVTLHSYADPDGSDSFTRTSLDVRHFIPLVHDNWIVALQGRVEDASASDGQTIPFFTLPSIGGADTLRGFREYRFTDRASLLLRGELRWTPASVLDMAVFVDEGTVAASLHALTGSALRSAWGIGARFHGDTFTALRVEVARGDEGWRYHLSKNVSF